MKAGPEVSIHQQNSYIYAFGILFNGLSLFMYGNYERIRSDGFLHGYNAYTWAILAINSVLGLTIALILKRIDNIFHLFAHQATTVMVMLLSVFLFDFHLTLQFVCSGVIVGCSIYIFTIAKHIEIKAPIQA